jgi:hypothetical protein
LTPSTAVRIYVKVEYYIQPRHSSSSYSLASHRGGPGSRPVWQMEFVVDKVTSGQVFSEYLGFPCQIRSFHQLLHNHHHHQFIIITITRGS